MSETFTPGMTVWRKSDGQLLIVVDFYPPTGRLYCIDANDYLVCPPLADLDATDPNAEPKPQKCPFCGAEAHRKGDVAIRIACRGPECLAEGPCKRTEAKAIQAWNSIRIENADESAVTHDFRPPQTSDSDPLTEEWLRKVGLLAGVPLGFKPAIYLMLRDCGNLVFKNPGSPLLFPIPTLKTIGDARQLCRLLGVPLTEANATLATPPVIKQQ